MSSHYPLIRRAVASLIPVAFASHAYGNCTVPQGTLTNIDAGVTATCDGASSGQLLSSVNENVQVVVNSGTLSNSIVDLAGAGSQFAVLSGANLNDGAVTVRGSTGSIVFDAGTNSSVAPGTVVLGGSGTSTTGTMNVAGNISALGSVPGAFLLTGLDGNQAVRVAGTLSNSSGLFISTGNGNDEIELFDSAVLQGGTLGSRLIDGGAGLDTLIYSPLTGGTSSLNVNSTGVELLLAGGNLTLGGTHGFTDVEVQDSASLTVSSIASLGTSSANISLRPDARLTLDLANNVPSDVTQNLGGSGTVALTGLGRATLSGNNTNFAGTLIAAASSNGVAISGAGQIGTGRLQVDGQARLVGGADYLLENSVSGGGGIYHDGTGSVTLGNQNEAYSGIWTINSGTLVAAGSQSTGTGEISIESAGTLVLDAGVADSILLNNLYGDGALIKRGTGTTTLAGGLGLSGVTQIQQGALRASELEGLGAVPVSVSADAALILDYSDASPLLAAQFMTGQGQFIKEGAGTLVVDAANTYEGGTVIRAGRVGLNDGQGLGTGNIQVDAGAILGIGGVQLDNSVTGAGQIIKTASNEAVLTGDNSGFSGELQILGGSVVVQDVVSLGTGVIDVGAGTTLQLQHGSNQTLEAGLAGAGDIIKSGGGRITIMDGGNSFLGDWVIQGGGLQVDGSGSAGFGNIDLAADTTLFLVNANGGSLSNTISGAGRVVKRGEGFMVISQGGQYTGDTDLQEGGLIVSTLDALGTGAVFSATGTSLVLDHAGGNPMLVDYIMQGAGAFTKQGSGTVVVDAANSYTGGTVVAAGRLGLNNGDALGTGAIQVDSGAILGIGNIALANNVTGAGQIIKTAGDVATLTGNNLGFTGELRVEQGSVAVNSLASLGTGTVTVASGATLNLTNATDGVFTPALGGAGTMLKQGAGRLDFTDPFGIGALTVSAGRVRLNTTGTTNATVAAGASLDGTGRLIGNLVNDGIVAPGNSIGTLTVQGNYVQSATGVLEIEFGNAGQIDVLDVTGTASLNGGTLRFVSLGGAEGAGGTFLTAAGGVSGTFATVETVGAALPLSVIYDATSVEVAPSVVSARPSTFNAQWLAGAEAALGYVERVSDAYGWAGDDHVWFQGFGARGTRDAGGASLGYRHESQGFAAGAIWSLARNLELGASLGWSTGDISLDESAGGGEQDGLLGSLGLRYTGQRVEVGGGLLLGKLDQSTVRAVSFSGATSRVNGETDSSLTGGYLQAGANLGDAGGWSWDVTARASLVRQAQDAYTEEGASPLSLSVQDVSVSTMEVQSLFSASRKFGGEDGVSLRLDVGARHLALQGDREIDAVFTSSNAPVLLQGDTRSSTQALVGAQLLRALTPRLTLSAGYAGQLGKQDHHEARLGVSLGF